MTYEPVDIVAFFEEHYGDYAEADARSWRDTLLGELERLANEQAAEGDGEPIPRDPFEYGPTAYRHAAKLLRGES